MRLLREICTYEKEGIYMEDLHLKPVQKAALSLIQSDLRFLYTVIERINPNESNYGSFLTLDISFLPVVQIPLEI